MTKSIFIDTAFTTLTLERLLAWAQSEPEDRVVKQETSLRVLDSCLGVGLCPRSRPGPDLQ